MEFFTIGRHRLRVHSGGGIVGLGQCIDRVVDSPVISGRCDGTLVPVATLPNLLTLWGISIQIIHNPDLLEILIEEKSVSYMKST